MTADSRHAASVFHGHHDAAPVLAIGQHQQGQRVAAVARDRLARLERVLLSDAGAVQLCSRGSPAPAWPSDSISYDQPPAFCFRASNDSDA